VDLDELYRDVILDHYQHPRHFGQLPDATARVGLHNPTCGDRIALDLKVEDGVVRDVAFSGHGCSISMASASMLSEAIRGRPLHEAEAVATHFIAYLTGEREDAPTGDLEALAGVRKFPARVKCATLAHNALKEAARQVRAPEPHAGDRGTMRDDDGRDKDREASPGTDGPTGTIS
jgi:nitrogen fixation NifU-like protein